MFFICPTLHVCVYASVCASIRAVVSTITVVRLGTDMNWLGSGVKRLKV